jgi:hypothetical protein
MLEKIARTPSNDPVQEKLRQDKANWNKEISSFINDLIHLKKTMNGWPSKFFKERSRITQPIPADPTTIIGSLTGDFQQLAQRGESIVQEQLNYSKNRRQKQPKLPVTQAPQTSAIPPTPEVAPATTSDLSKQLAAWDQKYGEKLISEGSSKLTRTFTRILNPTIGFGSSTKRRRHRMNILKRTAKVYKLLGKLQVKIVAPISGKQSIKDSYELVRTIKAEWGLVEESLQLYRDVVGQELSKEESDDLKKQKNDSSKEEVQEQSQQPIATQTEIPNATDDIEVLTLAKDIKNDYISILKNRLGVEVTPILSDLLDRFMKEPGPSKPDIARLVLQQYIALLESLRTKYGVIGNSLKEIENAIVAKEQSSIPSGVTMPKKASNQIEIVAQDFIKKWVGKTRHNILPGDTSDYRVNIFDMVKEIRDDVDQFMNLAESRKTEIDQYDEQARKIADGIRKMDAHMIKLYRLYFRVPKEMQGLV